MKSILLILLLAASTCIGQQYTPFVFAHNDYVHPIPFYSSYALHADYIEADIFLKDGKLLVAHTASEMDDEKTLEALYLAPLQKNIIKNNGFSYPEKTQQLTLMIDIKTEGYATLMMLVKKLTEFKQILACPTLQIVISGDVPDPKQWSEFPSFISFDGRPTMAYTKEQWNRIKMISINFSALSNWNGKGLPVKADRDRIMALRDTVHAKGKVLRFWAAPDFINGWSRLMDLHVDVICTDDVAGLTTFIKTKDKNSYHNKAVHTVYEPANKQSKKQKAPKNIILMIGDGMGLAQLYSGYTANHGDLNIFRIPTTGFSVTTSSDSYITDSAAGATAMATGKKTNNRFISVDSTGKPLVAITERIKKLGYTTAIISNGDISDATPACFYAHQPERSMSEAIANDFLSTQNDILIGAGTASFNSRKDGKDLFSELRKKKYTVTESLGAMNTIRNSKFVVVDNRAGLTMAEGRGDFLSKALKKTLATCTKNGKPFFIMEEGAQIDHGGHANDLGYVVEEVLDFDKAVGEAMKFVDENSETLLIITADHETGGLTLTAGDIKTGYVMGNFSTNDHTSVMVPVFAYGPSAELFQGVYPNTDIHNKIEAALKLLHE